MVGNVVFFWRTQSEQKHELSVDAAREQTRWKQVRGLLDRYRRIRNEERILKNKVKNKAQSCALENKTSAKVQTKAAAKKKSSGIQKANTHDTM